MFGVEFNSDVLPELKNDNFTSLLPPHFPTTSVLIKSSSTELYEINH